VYVAVVVDRRPTSSNNKQASDESVTMADFKESLVLVVRGAQERRGSKVSCLPVEMADGDTSKNSS